MSAAALNRARPSPVSLQRSPDCASHLPLLALLRPTREEKEEKDEGEHEDAKEDGEEDAGDGCARCALERPLQRGAAGLCPAASADVFLAVGVGSLAGAALRLLLYRHCCRVADAQQRGRALRAALPPYRRAGLERLDQAVLLLTLRPREETAAGGKARAERQQQRTLDTRAMMRALAEDDSRGAWEHVHMQSALGRTDAATSTVRLCSR